MIEKKIRELLEAACRKSEKGNLDWQSFSSEAFHAQVGSGRLHVRRTHVADEGFAPEITVQVADGHGRVVSETHALPGDEDFSLLNSLFESARKSALKSDRVLDDMLQSLLGTSK